MNNTYKNEYGNFITYRIDYIRKNGEAGFLETDNLKKAQDLVKELKNEKFKSINCLVIENHGFCSDEFIELK